MTYIEIKKMLREASDKKQAEFLKKFFKTGKGEYGEGDRFLGIKVPVTRRIVRQNPDITIKETERLINSAYHEERLAALLVCVEKFKKGNETQKEKIFEFYIKNKDRINNWDLVDLSAPSIIGAYLYDRDKTVLLELAGSAVLWDRRIAVMSTFYFIKHNKFDMMLRLAEILIEDKQDLMHKAVGWMLREIGKRDIVAEEKFLKIHYKKMPRTMLRYAIEKFPSTKRLDYLSGRIQKI